jgi:hypothetical protein
VIRVGALLGVPRSGYSPWRTFRISQDRDELTALRA